MSNTEALAIAPLVILMFWMGIGSGNFLPLQNAVNIKILQQSKMNVEFRVAAPPPIAAVQPEAVSGN